MDQMTEQLTKGHNLFSVKTHLKLVKASVDIYLKALTFDYIAILLNETLDEPSQTNVSCLDLVIRHV